MEQREEADTALSALVKLRDELDAERAELAAARDAAFAEIDAAAQQRTADASVHRGRDPADLLALYERAREHSGGSRRGRAAAPTLRGLPHRAVGQRTGRRCALRPPTRSCGATTAGASSSAPPSPGSSPEHGQCVSSSRQTADRAAIRVRPATARSSWTQSGAVLAERSESIGIATNNVAEYGGLIAGLAAAAELGARSVHVRMDSKLVVEQMSGRWQVKNSALRDLAREAVALRGRFDEVSFEWIPRAAQFASRPAGQRGDGPAAGTRGAVPPPRGASPVARRFRTLVGAADRDGDPSDPGSARRHRALGRPALLRAQRPVTDGRRTGAGGRAGRSRGVVRAGRRGGHFTAAAMRADRRDRSRASSALALVEAADFAEVDFGAWEGLTFAEVRSAYPDEMAAWLESDDGRAAGR